MSWAGSFSTVVIESIYSISSSVRLSLYETEPEEDNNRILESNIL